jgi:uncharacterized membrane protein
MIIKYIISSYLLSWLLQLPGFAFSLWFIKTNKLKTIDYFWGISRSLTLLTSGLIIFFGSHFLKFTNSNIFFFTLLLIFNSCALFYFSKKRKHFFKLTKNNWKLFLIEEFVFLFFLSFLTYFRSLKGDILDLEKFMDFGFIQSYLKEDQFPLKDMWLANNKVNYYTFGHFLCSLIIRLINVESSTGYNLCLAFIMGLIGINVFSLTINTITKTKKTYLPILAALLVNFGGNSHFIFFWLKNQTFKKFWYPDSTRYIHNTIHEFPSYSFIVSDLHAHLINLPFIFVYLTFFYFWIKNLIKFKKSNYLLSLALALVLGIFIMSNTWDFMIYSLALAMASIFLLLRKNKTKTDLKKIFFLLIKEAFFIASISLLVSSLWLLNFESISQGPRLLIQDGINGSPVTKFLELWSVQLLFLAIAIILNNFFKKKPNIFINTLITVSLILLSIPEIIYFKDIYPDHPRANTMFKFTYQAFCLMQIIVIWTLCQIKLKIKNNLFKNINFFLLLVISLITLCYSYFGYRDYYNFSYLRNFKDKLIQKIKYNQPEKEFIYPQSSKEKLTGRFWQKNESPSDFNLINYLNEKEKDRVSIIESVGESYSQHARISVFTGLPTILGWRVHEWLWRGSFDIPGKRTNEVKLIYEMPLSKKSIKLIKKFNIKYIIVGKKEQEIYQINHNQIKNLGEIIYQTKIESSSFSAYIIKSKFYENN